MLLLPPEGTVDSRPLCHISVNMNCFKPGSWITVIREGGTAEGPWNPGEPGALEQVAGGEGIRSHWHAVWDPGRTTLPRELTATQIFDAAREPSADPLAQEVLERAARVLAYAIYNVSLVLNCQLVVLGGTVGMHPALHQATRRILQTLRLRALPELRLSSLGHDAQLHGAIRLALQSRYMPA